MISIQDKLLSGLQESATDRKVKDVRIGLGYTAVQLDNEAVGLAWTPPREGSSCTHVSRKEPFVGSCASELLEFFQSSDPLYRALAVATANALISPILKQENNASIDNAIDLLGITATDSVAMVGYFGPLISQIEQIGCRFHIIEKNRNTRDTLSPEDGQAVLEQCDIAIVTGTSLINNTLEQILAALNKPRKAVLLGPSAPLYPEAFSGTAITQISGSRVIDGDAVLRVISEGGGTPRLKPYVAFETVFV